MIAHAGSRELSVIDAVGLLAKLESGERNSPIQGGSPYYPGILGVLGRRIKLGGSGPRAVALVGSRAFVAGLFSDTLDVVDTTSASNVPLERIRLGPEEDAAAIDEYLKSLAPVPSPHLGLEQAKPHGVFALVGDGP